MTQTAICFVLILGCTCLLFYFWCYVEEDTRFWNTLLLFLMFVLWWRIFHLDSA